MTSARFKYSHFPLMFSVHLCAAAAAALALQASTVWADTAGDCKSERDPGKRIAACSSLIGSGSVKGPDLASAYVHRGASFHDKALFDDAIKDYDSALLITPGSALALYERSLARVAKKDDDGALTDLNGALANDPTLVRALSDRAGIWYRKKDGAKALADVTAALKIDPKNSSAYYVRALVYDQRGDKDLALSDFAKAIEIKPKALYYFERGKALTAKGDKAGAIADFKKALELDPKHDAAKKKLASMGVDASADAVITKHPPSQVPVATPPAAPQPVATAKAASPADQPAPRKPIKPIVQMAYPDGLAEIASLLDQAAKTNPPPPAKYLAELYLARTGLHARNGRPDLALQDIQIAIKTEPSGIAYAMRATLLMDKDMPASLRDADEALKRDAKSWEVVSLCSMLYLTDALQTYQKGPREASFAKLEKLKALDSENKLAIAGWLEAAKSGAIKIDGNTYTYRLDVNGGYSTASFNAETKAFSAEKKTISDKAK